MLVKEMSSVLIAETNFNIMNYKIIFDEYY